MAAALTASHRQPAPWPVIKKGNVTLNQVTWTANGFSRPISLRNDASPLIKDANLMFKAQTDVPAPYEVYWQVVNTGIEAAQAGDLRGGFDAGATSLGAITRRERASYGGSHTIECFIVKSGYLVARSGQFVVNVR
ncbi:nucleotide-binding domain-containing protein (plasmid) [Cupriavidus basilensis]